MSARRSSLAISPPPAPVAPVAVIAVAATDAELVARARADDRWAAEALYRRHAADAMRIAACLLRRHADAEDVVQDAFVAALTKLGTLRDPASFGGWLGRIVANGARARLRRRRVLGWVGLGNGDDDATLDQLAAPGATAEQRAELSLLDRALAELPDGERIAWTLRHVEGWELRELAAALGTSLTTAKRRLAAAKRHLVARGAIAAGPAAELEDLDGDLP